MSARLYMGLAVKLQACLYALGFKDGDQVEWHHSPALGLRRCLDDGTYDPPENDPRHIVPLLKSAHAVQTNGKPATTAGSDKHAIAKAKRVAADEAEFRARLLARDKSGDRRRSSWPFRKMQSRPFEKRKTL